MVKKKILITFFVFILIIGIIYLLSNATKKTYAVGTTLADTVIALSNGSSWTSGASGVYYTNSHEYRYVGAEVNNFVRFNNDLYRIIGVFDTNSHGVTGKNLVKLIRARTIGSYTWGAYNSTNTSGTYSNYNNDWTGNTTGVKANANVLLNEFFYNKSNTSNTYGECSDWTYFDYTNGYKTNDCTKIVGYGVESSFQNYIQEATWHLKGYIGSGYSKQDFYLCERGQSTDITNCMSGNSGAYDSSTIAKIGLMYVSDYMYASSYYTDSDTTKTGYSYGTKNWLYNGFEWTITPDADSATGSFRLTNYSTVNNDSGNFGTGIRPTFYLKESVYVTGGNGSFDNPYTIACDDCDVEEPEQSPETTLTKLGLTANTTTPNFSTTATTNEGVFAAEDDLGTSYYFRGAVTNNYVKFAGFYWRIIRINGDGTIRMIYDGISAHANGESSTDRQIDTSAFNSTYNDNTYVGYMTGTAGASVYATTHSNTTNSTTKGVIDSWYKTNIVDNGYSGNVVDAIYCNDREVSTADSSYTGNGTGKTTTSYKARERVITNKTPTLKCSQVSDRFTTEATVSSVTGNDKLTYPVGFITADEVSMAGGVNGGPNSTYYLYSGNNYWTMSPYWFDGSYAFEFSVSSFGYLGVDNVDFVFGVRPVISISPDAIQYGTGISTDPFRTTSAI